MKEKLVIKNFGPVKSVELELGRFNVLIGENATGKSTVAKILAVCRYFSYIVGNRPITLSGSTNFFFQGLFEWGLKEFLKENTYIQYECSDYSVKLERSSAGFSKISEEGETIYMTSEKIWNFELKEKSQRFTYLLNELKKIRPDINQVNEPDIDWGIPTSFYQNEVASVLEDVFFLPTERGLQSIFSLGKNSIQNISDSLFNQLAALDAVARNFKNEISIETLDISYKNVDGRGYIKKNSEGEFHSLYNGASGYKSAIPIILSIKYYNEIRNRRKRFIVEEPELSLFPEIQHKLIQYLVHNAIMYGNCFLVTTHSPYTLTSLNNMMYAFNVGKDHPEEVGKVINIKYWINPEDVSAYMLLPEGNCIEILDREEGMIKAEKIDSISGFLNEQFDSLLNIELVPK